MGPVYTAVQAGSGALCGGKVMAARRNQFRRWSEVTKVSEKSLRNRENRGLIAPQVPNWVSPWNECEQDRQRRRAAVQ
jgi:hypothetical protein